LAALVASAATPLILWLDRDLQEAQVFLLLTVLIFITHRANIARLVKGTEGKIGKAAENDASRAPAGGAGARREDQRTRDPPIALPSIETAGYGLRLTRPTNSTAMLLSPDEKLDWLRLIRSDHVGPRTFRALLDHYGSAGAALAALPELARRGGATRPGRIFSRSYAGRAIAAAAKLGDTRAPIGAAAYPPAPAATAD